MTAASTPVADSPDGSCRRCCPLLASPILPEAILCHPCTALYYTSYALAVAAKGSNRHQLPHSLARPLPLRNPSIPAASVKASRALAVAQQLSLTHALDSVVGSAMIKGISGGGRGVCGGAVGRRSARWGNKVLAARGRGSSCGTVRKKVVVVVR